MAREMDVLCKNKAVKTAVLASMQAEGRSAKLRSFEQVPTCVYNCAATAAVGKLEVQSSIGRT